MRILLATPLYPPEIGGPATYAKFLEKELPPLGIAISVVPFSAVRRLPPGIRHIAYLLKLLIAGRGASIIFAQDAYSVGLPAVFAAKLLRLPLLIRVPGEYAWEQGVARFGVADDIETFEKKRYAWPLETIRAVQSWTARQADALVVPSPFFKSIILAWGVPEDRITVIENALESVQAEAVEHPQPPFVLSAGRLVGGKGFEGLINLMGDLPGWRLVIAGDGPLRGLLEREAQRLGVSERVSFIGRVSPAAMQGWYRAATAFVLNTRFESFSYQVAEALAAGVPVIATRVGGIPNLVQDGANGVLVPPDNMAAIRTALESIASEPGAWEGRVRQAVADMERLAPVYIVPKLKELLETLSS